MVRINKLSLSLLFSLIAVASTLSAMEKFTPLGDVDIRSATLELSPERVRTDGLVEGSVGLFYDKEGFFVREEDNDVRVHTYEVDKFLQGRTIEDVAQYAMIGKFKLSKFDNGEYGVRTHGDLPGGGAGGATIGFFIGKLLTHVVGQGLIQVAAICTGPGYFVAVPALEATFLPVIESASNVVALGTGVLGGVATGPV